MEFAISEKNARGNESIEGGMEVVKITTGKLVKGGGFENPRENGDSPIGSPEKNTYPRKGREERVLPAFGGGTYGGEMGIWRG